MAIAVIDARTINNFVEDGKEFNACVRKFFEIFDKDKDGALSSTEIQGGLREIAAMEYEIASILEKFDADRDGKLVLSEFTPLVKEIMCTMASGIGDSGVLVALDGDGLLLKAVEHEKCRRRK